MDFNFEKTFNDMINVFTSNLAGESEHLIVFGQDLLKQSKTKLETLSGMFISGSIDKEQLDLRIHDVKMTIENQLLAEEVRVKATAQKAINGAIDVLTSALSTALKLPI